MLSRFHRRPERDGQTGRIAISILRVSRLTRDKQEAQLWQRDRATLCVSEYCQVSQGRLIFEMTLFSRACVSPY